MTLTVLDGSTFCICDELGDVDGETTGFFAEDTRFLSLLRLTVNGARPLLLSSGKVEYFSAAFYMRNPLAGGLPQDALTIVRTRFVGDAMQPDDIAECILFALTRPPHVNVDELVVKALAQSSGGRILRREG